MDIKISDVIVSFLHDKNINTVFGIIGSANSHIYDSCVKSGITIINTHNEQAALLAAGGYYRTSGKLAVALVTAVLIAFGGEYMWLGILTGLILSYVLVDNKKHE